MLVVAASSSAEHKCSVYLHNFVVALSLASSVVCPNILKLRSLPYKTTFHIHPKQQVEADSFRLGAVNIRLLLRD
jgi:hypothetical protein